jgi:probable rRNA maturation factor
MQTIFFRSADRTLKFSGKKQLAVWIGNIFTQEVKLLTSLTYVFCSDEYLLKINRDFLQHDFYTDIVTFELSDSKDTIEGEIYISIDRVADNALNLGLLFKDEIVRVIFHGALHLCGYKDKKKGEIKLMRQKEDYYLSLYKERETKK